MSKISSPNLTPNSHNRCTPIRSTSHKLELPKLKGIIEKRNTDSPLKNSEHLSNVKEIECTIQDHSAKT